MKKLTTNLLLIVSLLVVAPATFTGCSTTDQSREAIIFYTFKDVQTLVHRAYDTFADRVVLGKVTPEERARVEKAYAQYQTAFRAAFILANQDYSSLTPTDVQKLADELLTLISKL